VPSAIFAATESRGVGDKCSNLLFEGTTNDSGNDPLFPLCRNDRLLCAGMPRSGNARILNLIKHPTATPLNLKNPTTELLRSLTDFWGKN
jgi:hypothetical protein